MSDLVKSAALLRMQLEDRMKQEFAGLKTKLNRGEPAKVADIKAWRRGWIDRAMAIRQMAKDAHANGFEDDAVAIKALAEKLENRARELEDKLKDIALDLEAAEPRGGILTHRERAARAALEGEHVHGLSCPMCGCTIPEAEAVRCAYCDHVLKEGAAVSTGWGVQGIDVDRGGALARIEALDRTYRAQLENERHGLLSVLRAGRRRTLEFENALDDAAVRLERIWQKLREVGHLSDDTSDKADFLLDRLLALKDAVFDPLQKEARLAWNHAQADGDNVVNCAHCGAALKVADPWAAGECVCEHCGGITKYSPHFSEYDIAIQRQMDGQIQAQRPAEEEFEHWKKVCIDDPCAANVKNFESAARAMYDKQLYYMKDPAKRSVAVDRYVTQALRDAQFLRSD